MPPTLFHRTYRYSVLIQHNFQHHPLVRILDGIYYFPYRWRKFILTFCRVQQNILINARLQGEFEDLLEQEPNQPPVPNTRLLSLYDLNQLRSDLNELLGSPILLSLLSYYVRAEGWSDISQPLKISEETRSKELSASQQEHRPQQLDYTSLFHPTSLKPIYGRTRSSAFLKIWRAGLERKTTAWKEQDHVYIPHYQTRRNVSSDTMERYWHHLGYSDPPNRNVTQGDLLRLYHETGHQIQGIAEMREAWKYNDLKPRVYYCGGGENYWPSSFMKTLCLDLLAILPNTNPATRFDTSRLTMEPLREDELLLTYDYTSFTTSLSELRYFLHFLGHHLLGHEIDVLDVHNGITRIDVGKYFMDYNESQNINCAFDVTRILNAEVFSAMIQLRSGMLGVQGNIALSTLLHGTLVGSITNSVDNCVVGDDALVRILADMFHEVDAAINTLGVMHAEKYAFWTSKDWAETDTEIAGTGWQFLKRPLDIDYHNYVESGCLFSFPNIAEIFIPDTIHRSSLQPALSTVSMLATQWGSYLHRLMLSLPEFSEDEVFLTLLPISRAYEVLGLDVRGMLPEQEISYGPAKGDHLTVFVPPVDPKVFDLPWEEVLCRNYKGSTVVVPRMIDYSINPGYASSIGQVLEGTTHKLQRLMVMLGYFTVEKQKEEILLDETSVDYIASLVTARLRPVVFFTVVKTPPVWYNEVIFLEESRGYFGNPEGRQLYKYLV